MKIFNNILTDSCLLIFSIFLVTSTIASFSRLKLQEFFFYTHIYVVNRKNSVREFSSKTRKKHCKHDLDMGLNALLENFPIRTFRTPLTLPIANQLLQRVFK